MSQADFHVITFQMGNSLDIIMLASNGYINMSKMCNSVGKNFNHWLAKDSSQALLKEIGTENLVINDKSDFSGTYVHPKLAIYAAAWCNAKYAIGVTDVVIGYYSNKATNNLGESIEKIVRLQENFDKRQQDIYDAVVQSKVVQTYNDTLVILKKNAPIEERRYRYYSYVAICTMSKKVARLINKHREKYPRLEVVHQIEGIEDADLLWHKYILQNKNLLQYDPEQNFSLFVPYDEKEMIRDLENIHSLMRA